jgi:hypothetical protein
MTTTAAPNPAPTQPSDFEVRQAAITRLRKKRGLQAHLVAYVMVNLLLNGIWLITMPGGFYWPMIPMLGWGIGVAFNVWDVYAPQPDEKRIEREMRRIAH